MRQPIVNSIKHCLLGFILLAGPLCAAQQILDFSETNWQNHESLGESVDIDNLTFTVNSGGAMKAVTTPHGLQTGYAKDAITQSLRITPPAGEYLTLTSMDATDLFQMPTASITVKGFRDDQLIAEQTIGPLWSDLTRSGVSVMLAGFTDVTAVEIRSAVDDSTDSDLTFFIDVLEYSTRSIPKPTPPEPPGLFGAFDGWMLGWLAVLAGIGRFARAKHRLA